MGSEILLYQSDDGRLKIQVRPENETVWLTQTGMVELFQSSKSNISEHIKHIFEEGELRADATVRNFRTARSEGNRQVEREMEHYNLDVIISVDNMAGKGLRVIWYMKSWSGLQTFAYH